MQANSVNACVLTKPWKWASPWELLLRNGTRATRPQPYTKTADKEL